MLLPDNVAPEDCIYYNGALVLKIVQKERRITLPDLFGEVKKQKSMSYPMLLLCLDWLYLIDCVIVNDGEVMLCS